MPYVEANGIRTFYKCEGTGPALLLIAGNAMEHTTFNEQLPALSRYFRCIVYDMRGIGRSDIPTDGYTTAEMAKDALALLTALEFEQAHVAGYSLGGAIAQEMALSAPERVLSLSLYSSYERPLPYMRLRYDVLIKIVEESTPELWAMYSAFSAFGPRFINEHEAEIRDEIAQRTQRWSADSAPSLTGVAGHYRAILSHDTASRLATIRCPTWIAVGSDDVVTPVSHSERMHVLIKGSELRVFPGKPHRILNFDAEDFNKGSLEFLLRQI
ncbi:alpha/beta fold hydrolase [Pusillimonas noertemannii]|uniref:alpha/beta fold hydrolase n=1 Tax=Pusillimonas noertemannii TaxID=305977 RepID=UPI000368D389|nr:alpha/beta hydrolase [Pusillimonas noertemannii]